MALKFGVYRLLRPGHHRGYRRRIQALQAGDPLAASRRHLDRLLSFAAAHNRYYACVLPQPRAPGAPPRLAELPLLTKEIVRQRFDDLQSSRQPAPTYRNSSGGSTGAPVTLVQDEEYASWTNATQGWYFREFLGAEMNEARSVWLWGSERDTMKVGTWRTRVALFLQSRLTLNTFDTTERRWLDYLDRIRAFRPHYVAGYAGSLYRIACVARRHNVRPYRPKFLHSSAEMLRDFMRAEIEEQFDAKVHDYYGSREVGAIAGECRAGRMHVFSPNNVVEVVDEASRPAADGEEGRIVVTNLHNHAMPMIRYEIGDTGALGAARCACGSPLPVLDRLTGRITDHFVTKDGGLVHGEYFTHLFYFREWVEQFRVDQLDYDRVRVSVVPRAKVHAPDVEEIEGNIRLVMGGACRVEWRHVDRLEQTPQGKHLFTRCLVER